MSSNKSNKSTSPSRRSFIKGLGAAGAMVGIATVPMVNATTTKQQTGYDVIVLGGGFAGVTAARDLSQAGKKVLLLEARNRLGGRTFTSDFAGKQIELGGTWIHWTQPHIWAEVTRYDMSLSESEGAIPEKAVWSQNGKLQEGSPEKQWEVFLSSSQKFSGEYARNLYPRPWDPYHVPELMKLDHMSAADRIEEIRNQLSDDEYQMLNAFMALNCHNDPSTSAFVEMLRWDSLGGYDMGRLMDAAAHYKLKDGTIGLINKMLEDSNVDVRTNTPVYRVEQSDKGVRVFTEDDEIISAKACVCALPINVLDDIEFEPSLNKAKQQLSKDEHTGKGVKLYIHVKGESKKFGAFATKDHPIQFIFTEKLLKKDEQIMVAFGTGKGMDANDNDSIEKVVQEFLPDAKVVEAFGYDWTLDPFSRGTWATLRPGHISNYLRDAQKPEGRCYFAGGDIANGWRGFIDGAIESGAHAAQQLIDDLG